ncbi:odorant receptor 49b-like [Lycorma delicatula]|uniref:odorant receptor 49b-like n=1 Tax=Lycorma delicatula TaxID=130591 RepID=UPI003F510B39
MSVYWFKQASLDDMKWNLHMGKKNPERIIPYMIWVPYDETISPYYEVTHCIVFTAEIIQFFQPLILLKIIFYFGLLSVLLFAVSTVPFGSTVYFQSLFCSVGFTAELFFLCIYGENLSSESQKVGISAYNSLWYEYPNNVKKAFLFMLLRSQKKTQFNVRNNFIEVCLKTYIQVFQASFSYFTVLRKVHEKEL